MLVDDVLEGAVRGKVAAERVSERDVNEFGYLGVEGSLARSQGCFVVEDVGLKLGSVIVYSIVPIRA